MTKRPPLFATLSFLLTVVLLAGCAGTQPAAPPVVDPPAPMRDYRVEVVLVQMNDVYEITPVSGGTRGGLARVATLLRALEAANPHTYAVIAGDFFSPSALGTAKVDGERLAGRQMVAVLNALGLDYATFGNHEFDVKEDAFFARLDESEFNWISANITGADGQALPGVQPSAVIDVTEEDGDRFRLGLVGVTLDANDPDYVQIEDYTAAMQREVRRLRGRVDAVAGLTHLAIEQDRALAAAVPELDLVMGGHEHENMQYWVGQNFTPITKADANARSLYVHRLIYDTRQDTLHVTTRFVPVTDEIKDEPAVAAEVQRWVDAAFAGFRAAGFEPTRTVVDVTEPLDGLEASVRNRPTNLTDLIAEGMLREVEGADAAIFNSGSIRIDDVLPPGAVSEYDVIRILPFGGQVLTIDIKGSLLDKVLRQGLANVGSGGFLQTANTHCADDSNACFVGDAPMDPARTYKVAITDFLMTGQEKNLDYLNRDNPDVTVAAEGRDVRMALIDALKRKYGAM